MLTNYDYLIGIEDFTSMGSIRYKSDDSDDYINASAKYLVPPIESLRKLCDACHEIELAEERNELPEQRWLDQLIDPGTSLGGARPKAMSLIQTANYMWLSFHQRRIWRTPNSSNTSRTGWLQPLASMWQRHAP